MGASWEKVERYNINTSIEEGERTYPKSREPLSLNFETNEWKAC